MAKIYWPGLRLSLEKWKLTSILANSASLVAWCEIIPLSRARQHFYKRSISWGLCRGPISQCCLCTISPYPCSIYHLEANPASQAYHRLHKSICSHIWDRSKGCCWLWCLTCLNGICPGELCCYRFVTHFGMFKIFPSRITSWNGRLYINLYTEGN
mgnify:CR=1 FL=1